MLRQNSMTMWLKVSRCDPVLTRDSSDSGDVQENRIQTLTPEQFVPVNSTVMRLCIKTHPDQDLWATASDGPDTGSAFPFGNLPRHAVWTQRGAVADG